ncbi:glycoside hydrolase family 25 protein [Mycena polygramma]|nr:glycoside hydrolase family 25 protein [Mycena polygramma]
MKLSAFLIPLTTSSLLCGGASIKDVTKRAQPQGIDVSHFQANVDWATVKANGISFVYIKATEGTTFLDPSFSSKYSGATAAGLIRGGYHFAHPDSSTGAAQANYFLAHGGTWYSIFRFRVLPCCPGGWSADNITLPGALDIEYPASGPECYGLSASAMVSWISDFSSTYYAATTRYPVIYTTTDWWTTCTGNSAAFAANNPLWIAHHSSSMGPLPAGWSYATFWQYADSGPNPGDQDLFNGDAAGLQRMASG